MGVIVLAVLVQKFSEIVVLGRLHLRPHPRRPRTPAGHENDKFGRCRRGPILGSGSPRPWTSSRSRPVEA